MKFGTSELYPVNISRTAWAHLDWDDVNVEAMFYPNPYSGGAGLFYAHSNLQEANLKTPVFHSKQSIYSLCGSIQQVCSVLDLSASDDAYGLNGVHEDVIIKQQVPSLLYGRETRVKSKATASAPSYELKREGERKCVSFDCMLLNSLSGLWQAKPDVKWLLEFIQRGQRENKNITRELQLQPSNMTSVCFCAFD